MARKIVWSHGADTDLDSIAGYIARDSRFYAAAFVREIKQASLTLKTFCERGRVVPELDQPNTREILIRDYRLIYKIEGSRVVIVALIHGARDLKKLWQKSSPGI